MPITEARQIPVGSLLDTRKGTVRLTSARDSKGTTQNGDFAAGVFQVLQSRAAKAKGLTELRLKGSSFKNCTRRAKAPSTAQRSPNAAGAAAVAAHRSAACAQTPKAASAPAAATPPPPSAAPPGPPPTAATARSPKSPAARVTVRDLRRRKNITLRTGKSYLAKARR